MGRWRKKNLKMRQFENLKKEEKEFENGGI